MTISRRKLISAQLAIAISCLTSKEVCADTDNIMVILLKDGPVKIRLRPDLAPKHVQQIKTLVREKFYDGITFHRVIAGFMAQTGDPRGNGTGGSVLPNIPAEFTKTPFVRGTVAMARASDPNSANSQFFICFSDASFLNGQYTVFGEVISGMQYVDNITKGDRANNGAVKYPDKMITVRLQSTANLDADNTRPTSRVPPADFSTRACQSFPNLCGQ